ncbi:MAG: carboxypeptidase-like regulatory domain-containing protein, partial [Planctomycetota bacterium]
MRIALKVAVVLLVTSLVIVAWRAATDTSSAASESAESRVLEDARHAVIQDAGSGAAASAPSFESADGPAARSAGRSPIDAQVAAEGGTALGPHQPGERAQLIRFLAREDRGVAQPLELVVWRVAATEPPVRVVEADFDERMERHLDPGEYAAALCASATEYGPLVPLTVTDVELEVALSPPSIWAIESAVLVAGDLSPVADATCALTRTDLGAVEPDAKALTVTTDVNGMLVVEGLMRGEWEILVTASGFAPATRTVTPGD